MFGAIYGDVIGSYYETHCTKEYRFEFHRDSTFTDDSVLIAAVCQAILYHPADITRWQTRARAKEYAAHYRQYYARYPSAGFGQMFAKWAKDPDAPDGRSYANGAAMRVIPIGYAYDTLAQTLLQAQTSCLPTHKHPAAIKGAQAVAMAIFLARHGADKAEIKTELERRFRYDLSVPVDEIRTQHVFDSRTPYSVPPAIAAFLASEDYESAVRTAVSFGGDADTQACIAGGIAEAYYKEIPEHIRRFCDRRIDPSIRHTIKAFHQKYFEE